MRGPLSALYCAVDCCLSGLMVERFMLRRGMLVDAPY
jgi:hypothetical protein